MEAAIICIIIFLIGYYCGRKHSPLRTIIKEVYVKDHEELSPQQSSYHNQTNTKPNTYIEPQTYRKFRDSRWEERDDLFWGMMSNGICLEQKRRGFLLTPIENTYLSNLHDWFGEYCHIHSQVSLGQLIEMLEDNLFTDEERKRFFSIYSLMAVDYVLVSKKTKKILCIIELNDSTHESIARKERDQKLGALMEASCIPFIPVSTSQITLRPDIWKFRRVNHNMSS